MNKSKRLTHYMTVSPSSRLAQLHCVNCWHINEYESAAMWNLYAGKGAGLAIQTSYKEPKQSVLTAKHVDPVYFALVRYIDYEKEKLDGPAVDSDG